MPKNAENKPKFTANQLKFIDWLAMGKFQRSPPTQQMFADSIKVHNDTVTRWKKGQKKYTAEQFQDAVTARARELIGDDLPNIIGSLRDQAVKGNFQHQKLVLEMAGEYTPAQKIDVDIKVEKELDAMLDDLERELTSEEYEKILEIISGS